MIHARTGNGVDVVYDMDRNGRKFFVGIKPQGKDLIPLIDPLGLAEVLVAVLKEIEQQDTTQKHAIPNKV